MPRTVLDCRPELIPGGEQALTGAATNCSGDTSPTPAVESSDQNATCVVDGSPPSALGRRRRNENPRWLGYTCGIAPFTIRMEITCRGVG